MMNTSTSMPPAIPQDLDFQIMRQVVASWCNGLVSKTAEAALLAVITALEKPECLVRITCKRTELDSVTKVVVGVAARQKQLKPGTWTRGERGLIVELQNGSGVEIALS